jgi:hypothetical protein
MRDTALRCIASGHVSACAISRSDFDKTTAGTRSFLSALAARYPRVHYVDLSDFFCDAKTCGPVKDGCGLYWDDNHVSTTAARQFARQYVANQR